MGATFYVYAGGSWRRLDLWSGRVAGWAGRAGFCFQRRGRLHVAGAAAVLRGLRALQDQLPTTVRDGLPLTQRRATVKKCSCCNQRAPAKPHNALVQLNLSTQCASSTQTSLPQQPVKSDAAVQACAAEPSERPVEPREKSRDKDVARRVETRDKVIARRVEMRDKARDTPSSAGTGDDDAPVVKELLVQEEDVAALRSLLARGLVFPFSVDLRRFDTDEEYKSGLFYRINPLVTLRRCPRIAAILARRQRERQQREFTRVLGLRAVTKQERERANKSANKLSNKSNASTNSEVINDTDSDFESETSTVKRNRSRNMNKYKTILRSGNKNDGSQYEIHSDESRIKRLRPKRHTINRSYIISSDKSTSDESNEIIDALRQTDRNRSKNNALNYDGISTDGRTNNSRHGRKIDSNHNNNDGSLDSDDSRSILWPYKNRMTRRKDNRNDASKDRQRKQDELKGRQREREDESKENRSGNKRKYRDSSEERSEKRDRNVSFTARTVGSVARNLNQDAEKRVKLRSLNSSPIKSSDNRTDQHNQNKDSSQETGPIDWANRNGTTKRDDRKDNERKESNKTKKSPHLNRLRDTTGRFKKIRKVKNSSEDVSADRNRSNNDSQSNNSRSVEKRATRHRSPHVSPDKNRFNNGSQSNDRRTVEKRETRHRSAEVRPDKNRYDSQSNDRRSVEKRDTRLRSADVRPDKNRYDSQSNDRQTVEKRDKRHRSADVRPDKNRYDSQSNDSRSVEKRATRHRSPHVSPDKNRFNNNSESNDSRSVEKRSTRHRSPHFSPDKNRFNNDSQSNDSRSVEKRVTRLNNSLDVNEKSLERRIVRSDKSDDKLQSDSKRVKAVSEEEVSVKGDAGSKSKEGSVKEVDRREKKKKQWSVASSQDTSGQLRREYSSLEDHCIVQWLSLGARARKVNGNSVWRELQGEFSRLAGRARSWHSLRNRYLRSILPALGSLALPPGRVAALRAAQATGELKSRRRGPRPHPLALPRVRSAWALRPRTDVSEDSAAEHIQIQDDTHQAGKTAPQSTEKRALRSSRTDTSHTDTHTNRHKHTDRQTAPQPSPTYSELTRRFANKQAVSTPEVEIERHGSVSPPAKRTRRLFNPNSKL